MSKYSTPPPISESDLDLVQRWLAHYAPRTVYYYGTDVHEFLSDMRKPLAAITRADIERHLTTRPHLTDGVRRRKVAALHGLFHYAKDSGYLAKDVAYEVQHHPSPQKGRVSTALDRATIGRLFDAMTDLRGQVAIELMYYCGMTLSEVTALRWRDLRQHRGTTTVQISGAHKRSIVVPDPVIEVLEALMDQIVDVDQVQISAGDPIFLSRRAGPLSARSLRRIISGASRRAGISTEVTANRLRAAHAMHAIEEGASLADIQATLGFQTLRSALSIIGSTGQAASSLRLSRPPRKRTGRIRTGA